MSIAGFVLGILSIIGTVLGNLDVWGYGETLFTKSPISRCLALGSGVVGILLGMDGMINALANGYPWFLIFVGLVLSIMGTIIAFALVIARLIFLHSL
jgi:hypothetical protein